MCVPVNRLIEDTEVVPGGLEMPLLFDLEHGVKARGSRSQARDPGGIG